MQNPGYKIKLKNKVYFVLDRKFWVKKLNC